MKIAQMVISSFIQAQVTIVEQLNDTPRGKDGFGSTGSTKF